MHTSDLASEWALLQNQFDSYEKYSLLIKLLAIVLTAATFLAGQLGGWLLLLLLILWVQDAIWKTFQSRIDARLLVVENLLSNKPQLHGGDSHAYQFNSQYQQYRPSFAGLLRAYARQALRPTVAFPHVPLLLGVALFLLQ